MNKSLGGIGYFSIICSMNFSRQIFDLLTVNSVIIIQFTNLFVVRPLKVNSAIKSLLRTNLRHSVLGRMRSAVKIDFSSCLEETLCRVVIRNLLCVRLCSKYYLDSNLLIPLISLKVRCSYRFHLLSHVSLILIASVPADLEGTKILKDDTGYKLQGTL